MLAALSWVMIAHGFVSGLLQACRHALETRASNVCHGHDPACQRDILSLEAAGIACSVPALMVTMGDFSPGWRKGLVEPM